MLLLMPLPVVTEADISIRSWWIGTRVRRCIRSIEAKRDHLVRALTNILKKVNLYLLS